MEAAEVTKHVIIKDTTPERNGNEYLMKQKALRSSSNNGIRSPRRNCATLRREVKSAVNLDVQFQ